MAVLSGQASASAGGVPPVYGAPGLTIVLVSNVTAPVRAKALPVSAAPVVTVTDAWAMMVPWKIEYVPRVAELPTCQKTLAAVTPPVRIIWLLVAVVSEVAIWKTKKLVAEPLSVRLPDMPSEDVDVYRPGVRVCPAPMVPETA
jgi:hypothetical protein